uniref:GPCR family 3 nine cysteines domain-containing protein n=1 Tax=Anas zonorhyncha TaxID=75864 RepID=A0A8B9ZXA6_9AVES
QQERLRIEEDFTFCLFLWHSPGWQGNASICLYKKRFQTIVLLEDICFILCSLQKVQSTCSQHCRPGQMKKVTESPHTCCYECVYCPENHYSNQTAILDLPTLSSWVSRSKE